MTAEVVQIREGAPLLTDIPAMLRRMADKIESGEMLHEVDSAILMLPRGGDYPLIFGWGDVEGEYHPAIQCELAKMWLLTNIVART